MKRTIVFLLLLLLSLPLIAEGKKEVSFEDSMAELVTFVHEFTKDKAEKIEAYLPELIADTATAAIAVSKMWQGYLAVGIGIAILVIAVMILGLAFADFEEGAYAGIVLSLIVTFVLILAIGSCNASVLRWELSPVYYFMKSLAG